MVTLEVGGRWYKINNNFVTEINDGYNQIPLSDIQFINYDHSDENNNEGVYNSALQASIAGSVLLHEKSIYYGGGSGNQIEVCDVLTPGKALIHIKHSGGSSTLSHLFNQAAVSSEALLDNPFRAKLHEKLEELNSFNLVDNEFRPANYTVILGIISDNNSDRPRIPFFSKVSLRYAIRTIKNLGYTVQLKNIKPA